jgi:beta-lactam-binding protein with PASTA domain
VLKTNLRNFLWVTPFIAFLLGYQLINFFQQTAELTTPNIIGHNLYDALKNCSAQNLNLRIITEKTDPSLPDQIIISQKPYAGQTIKPNQTIFVVTSRKPDLTLTPDLIGKTNAEIKNLTEHDGSKILSYSQHSAQKIGTCIAQNPEPHSPMHKRQVTVYLSAGLNQPVLMPDLVHLELAQVQEFLQANNLKLAVVNLDLAHKNNFADTGDTISESNGDNYNNYLVAEQWPLAGTILKLDQLSEIRVKVAVA